MTDEEIADIISEFGLFDGDTPAELYAHYVPNALDPEDMYGKDGKVSLYFELFTDKILKTIDEGAPFMFKYSAILECDDRTLNELRELSFEKNDVIIKLEKSTEPNCCVEFHAPISDDYRNSDGCKVPFYMPCKFEIMGVMKKTFTTYAGYPPEPDYDYCVCSIKEYLKKEGDPYYE